MSRSAPPVPSVTGVTPDCLAARYRALVCDLDGVVYRGPEAVPGAIGTLDALFSAGLGIVFATNNASRPPEDVAQHVEELGLAPGGWSVVTSAEAAAAHVAGLVGPGARVLAVGGPGVSLALQSEGLVPVRVSELDGPVEAVVQGLGTDVSWRELDEVAHQTRLGVPWIATNLDLSLPGARGPAPGNGSLVAAVRSATDAEPHVTGKPGPDLYDLARQRLGADARTTLGIGDRLDTDIAGARAAGIDSLLVLTGVATLHDLAQAGPGHWPTYVAADLRGLLREPVALRPGERDWDGLARRLGLAAA